MNCAPWERVTNFLEKSVFTWKDMVSAAKSSKECTPNHFLTNFQIFEEFLIKIEKNLRKWFGKSV